MSTFFPTQPVVSPGDHPTGTGLDAALYEYDGHAANSRENKYEGGLGVYKSDYVDFLNASGDVGFFGPSEGAGTQVGARGEMNTFGVKGSLGNLAEAVTLGAATTTTNPQGGWENFLSGEVHGPRAAGEASVGTDGLVANAGADIGFSAKLGGAEYDWFFGGTEISAGAGVGFGAGGGLSWSDDDKDGYHEFGANLGVEWWEGGSVGLKTEAPGHIADMVMNSQLGQSIGNGIMEGGDALLDWAFPPDEGLSPTAPTLPPEQAGF